METAILKLASSETIQFGVTTLVLIAIFFWFLKNLLNTNKHLVKQNQENIVSFLNQLNHQQTLNREAQDRSTQALEKMTVNLDQNNHINEKLIEYLKKNG